MPAAKLTALMKRHQHQKAGAVERAVRRQQRRKQRRLVELRIKVVACGHRRVSIPGSWPKIIRHTRAKSRCSRPCRRNRQSKAVGQTAAKPQAARRNQPKPKPWTPAEVHEAFSRFRKANPEPKGELEHLNPYTLLVAVVLSAQATDAGVNKATRALFAVADTPQKMLALGEEKVRDYIKTIGLYRNKAKNVIALSEKLIAEFGGEVPRTRAELEIAARRRAQDRQCRAQHGLRRAHHGGRHPRVPRRQPHRAGARQDAARGRAGLEKVIPSEFMLHAHHWLILHGRYTCLARKPRCEVCLINDLCRWPEKTV
mgnify:CR=1 FL=1